MALAGFTGNTRTAPCPVCGADVFQREDVAYSGTAAGLTWWAPVRHKAPCGAPCLGGGVRPLRDDERAPGVSGIAHAHREKTCGAIGCGGGKAGAA